MELFPFFTDISDKTFLIIGGGAVAREKLESIGRFQTTILMIAKELPCFAAAVKKNRRPSKGIAEPGRPSAEPGDDFLSEEEKEDLGLPADLPARLRILRRAFLPEDLMRSDYVIGATGDAALNAEIARLCKEKGIPVNIVDDAEKCTFVMPSMIKRGPLCVAISTGGNSPAYAKKLREEMEISLPEHIEDILWKMGELRKQGIEAYPDPKERKAYYEDALRRLLQSYSKRNK